MYQSTVISNRTSFLDRRRLIEARIARDCERLRREIVDLRGGSNQAAAKWSGSTRVETR